MKITQCEGKERDLKEMSKERPFMASFTLQFDPRFGAQVHECANSNVKVFRSKEMIREDAIEWAGEQVKEILRNPVTPWQGEDWMFQCAHRNPEARNIHFIMTVPTNGSPGVEPTAWESGK